MIYDEATLETFREGYEAMTFYERARENPALVAGAVLAAVVFLVDALVVAGLV